MSQQRSRTTLINSQNERSYIAFFGQTLGNMFEASVAPHFTVHTRGERFFVQITPKFVVRQGTEESHPVRTPSYMPGGKIYLFPRRPRPAGSADVFFTLGVTHHSNGQDGPFFNSDGTINYRNGSFSTNPISVGVHYAGPTGVDEAGSLWSVEYEWHWSLLGREPLLGDRFGFHRVWLDWSSARFHSWWAQAEAEVRVGYIFGDMLRDAFGDRAVLSASVRAVLGAQNSFGLFVNFYHGQDYYNIQFPNTRSLLRAGLSLDFNSASFLFPDWLPLPSF